MIKQLTIAALSAALLALASGGRANDCLTAQVVDSAEFPVGFVVDTATMTNATTVPCANTAQNGPEIWYHLTGLQPGGHYSVQTSAVDDLEDTRVAVYTEECGSPTLISCTDDVPESGFAFVDFQTITETSVLVLVEVADPAATGAFQVSISQFVPANPGDGCANPILMPATTLPIELDVTPSELSNDRDASCGRGSGGPESWVLLPPLADGDYILETTQIPGGPALDTRLELFANPDCQNLTSLACNNDINADAGNLYSSIRFHSSGETFLAFVEDNTFDLNTISLRLSTAGGLGASACDIALDLSTHSFPINLQQNLAIAVDLAQGPCSVGPGAVDRWYRLPALSATSLHSLRTETTTGLANDVTTSIAVYRGSCGALELVACNNGDGGHANVELLGSASDTFFALVEVSPVGGSLLRFNLVLEETRPTSPATNTDCFAATTIGSMPFSDSADLRGAAFPQAWYSFTPTANGTYSFDVLTSGLGTRAQLRIAQGGCAAGLVDVCGSPFVGASPYALPFLHGGTTYKITISAPAGDPPLQTSLLSIDGPLTEGIAANATCANATSVSSFPFSSTQPISGEGLINLAAQLGGTSCRGELYYRIVPTADGTVVVTAAATDGAPAAIAMMDGCISFNVLSKAIGSLRIPVASGSPVLVLVEPMLAAANTSIAVSISQEAASANDQCPHATVIGELPFIDSADFATANDEPVAIGCGGPTNRRDLFWYFTPAASGRYRVAARSDNDDVDTAIAVLSSGCGTAPSLCVDDTLGSESVILDLVGSTTYFFAVEGPPADSTCACPPVTFELDAVPESSGGDACDSAVVLTKDDLPYTSIVDTSGNAAAKTFLQGPSQFYRFTATSIGVLHARATPQIAALNVGVGIAYGSCSPQIARDIQGIRVAALADSEGPGDADEASLFLLPGDVVTIIVESHEPTGGDIGIDIRFLPPGVAWLAF